MKKQQERIISCPHCHEEIKDIYKYMMGSNKQEVKCEECGDTSIFHTNTYRIMSQKEQIKNIINFNVDINKKTFFISIY